jgi:hypothetical protein
MILVCRSRLVRPQKEKKWVMATDATLHYMRKMRTITEKFSTNNF